MSVTYDVIEDGSVVLQHWNGAVTRDDLMVHEQQHLTDPRIKPGASVLVDAREAYFGITQEEVGDIVNCLYALSRHPLKIQKCALLVNVPTLPLARAYEKSVNKEDMNQPTFRLHSLKGSRKGVWAVTVRANWRITFRFVQGNAYDVDLEDYH